jgi:hypothetical protein
VPCFYRSPKPGLTINTPLLHIVQQPLPTTHPKIFRTLTLSFILPHLYSCRGNFCLAAKVASSCWPSFSVRQARRTTKRWRCKHVQGRGLCLFCLVHFDKIGHGLGSQKRAKSVCYSFWDGGGGNGARPRARGLGGLGKGLSWARNVQSQTS